MRSETFAATLAYLPGRIEGTRGVSDGPADALAVLLGVPVFDAAWDADVARSLPLEDGAARTTEMSGAVYGRRTVSYRVIRSGGNRWTVTSVGLETPMVCTLSAERHTVATRLNAPAGAVVQFVRSL